MGSHQSKCTLLSEFLKKAESYTMQIESFIVNITPQINTITGSYMEIFKRPTNGETNDYTQMTIATKAAETAAIPNRLFQPVNPKSSLDILLALKIFCDYHNGLSVSVDASHKVTIALTAAFGKEYYVKVDSYVAELLQLPEYLYNFEDLLGVVRKGVNDQEYPDLFYSPDELAALNVVDTSANNTIRIQSNIENVGLEDTANITAPLNRLDTRLSLDVVSTIANDSKIILLDGIERRKKLIARFPIKEAITNFNEYLNDTVIVSQIINVGLEDMARNSSETQITNLHTGDILVVNTFIEARYLERGVIVTQDADFEKSGFFYLQMLFSKRIK